MWSFLTARKYVTLSFSERARVHATLFFVSLFFGGFYVVGKLTLRDVPGGFLVFCRVAGAALFLQAFCAMRGIRRPPARGDLWKFPLYALLGVVLNQLLFIYGLDRTTATASSILITTIPVFTVAFALILRSQEERLTGRRLAGIALAMAGVLALLGGDFGLLLAGGRSPLLGNVMIVVNCASYALYLVLSRPMTLRMDSLHMTAWVFTFGVLGTLPFGLYAAAGMDFAALPARAWAGIAYAVVFPTMLAYWMNIWAMRRAGAAMVALYVYLQPVVAVALAAVFLGERLTPWDGLSAALVFAGMYLASVRRHAVPLPTLQSNSPAGPGAPPPA